MSVFSRNVVASLLATGWGALVQFVVVPVLLMSLGVASFALIGFYTTLLAALAILDLGLSTALMRSMAGAGEANAASRVGDELRTWEGIFFTGGILIGGAVVLAAPLVAARWLSSDSMSVAEIERAVRWIGVLIGLRWPIAPYIATLQGLQRQVGMSALGAAATTVANGGGALLLWTSGSSSIELYLAWQCACAAIQLVLMRSMAWRALPAGVRRRFDLAALLPHGRFASGLTTLSLAGMLLGQGDKLLLAKLVPLDELGLYTTALTVSGALYIIITPVFSAALPRLSERAAASDDEGLRKAFDASQALMSALIVPVAAFLILFSGDVLSLWTLDADLASRGGPLLALLAAGTLLNGFMNVPYALQLARGNTVIGLKISGALAVVMVPLLILLVREFGLVGGAALPLVMGVVYLAFGLPMTYRVCLGSRDWWSFYRMLILQQAAPVAVLAAARTFVPWPDARLPHALALAATLAVSLALSTAASQAVRRRWTARSAIGGS